MNTRGQILGSMMGQLAPLIIGCFNLTTPMSVILIQLQIQVQNHRRHLAAAPPPCPGTSHRRGKAHTIVRPAKTRMRRKTSIMGGRIGIRLGYQIQTVIYLPSKKARACPWLSYLIRNTTFGQKDGNGQRQFIPAMERILTYNDAHDVAVAIYSSHWDVDGEKKIFDETRVEINGKRRTLMSFVQPGCFLGTHQGLDCERAFQEISRRCRVELAEMLAFMPYSECAGPTCIQLSNDLDWEAFEAGLVTHKKKDGDSDSDVPAHRWKFSSSNPRRDFDSEPMPTYKNNEGGSNGDAPAHQWRFRRRNSLGVDPKTLMPCGDVDARPAFAPPTARQRGIMGAIGPQVSAAPTPTQSETTMTRIR
ncbi:hypothetical protein B0H13DRAFT_2678344 [Mycena leptocephala]|nr:hypothetical protein B0H13DRAFT_2678344 [Mycena leptocephala]